MAPVDAGADADAQAAPVLAVTVAHGVHAGEVLVRRLAMPAGSRVRDALATAAATVPCWPAGVDGRPPEGWTVAVWGRRCMPDRMLREGDRVELLRPLACDPKESRRLRYRRTSGRQGGIERGRTAVPRPPADEPR